MPDSFHTDRLRIHPMAPEDLGAQAKLNADVEVMRHLTGRASTAEESATEFESSLGTRWSVFSHETGEFLGWVGAVPAATGEYDVGWRFRRSAWGRGFATEAARELVEQLFAEGAVRLFAQTMAVNERSRAVMTRIGFTFVRTLHLEFEDPLPGTEKGEVEYELTRATWQQRS